jgi:hypothetical protein
MEKVDLRGMGGKEKEIAKLYPELERESGPLHDFVDLKTGQRYEMKKTANPKLQSWIDPTKYVDLSEDDRNIVFRFVHYDKDTGDFIRHYDTTLGKIVDRFCPNEVLEAARNMNSLYPKRSQFQFKLNIVWLNE